MLNIDTEDFNIKQAHAMVRQQRNIGNDVRWDGWDIVFFRSAEHGVTSPDGAFRNGHWGFENRFEVDSEGIWSIDTRNLRRLRRAGNRPGRR